MAMTVRELINELLDCDMDSTVDVVVSFSNGQEETGNIEINRPYRSRSYIELQVDLTNVQLQEEE